MSNISWFDQKCAEKTYKKCCEKGLSKYSEIAVELGLSESFVKAIFSEHRKKLNLYHLIKLSYALNCTLYDFIPNQKDYAFKYGEDIDEEEGFYKSIEEEDNYE